MTPEREAQLRGFERVLGHSFRDLELLDRALTHTSRANEDLEKGTLHNEPLEFLGDSVLGFVVADMLHAGDPEGDEGVKSKTRAHLVSSASLAVRARALGLPDLLLLGRGEEKTGGRGKESLWANAYEAVVAALYLDGGLEAARALVEDEFRGELTAPQPLRDPKSALQEFLQGRGEAVPEYVLLASEGPSHRRHFRIGCRLGGQTVSEGEGFSKKEAQRQAAERALEVLCPPEGRVGEPTAEETRSSRPRGKSRPRRRPRPDQG